ncbi:uncharacterized protein [Elaeis guineensis]|uniref:uncharacterized protein n=1 Tax=Elaeis guineensis var. tenera TaxID=51953 RepID=UPI003C6CE10C
MRDMNVQFGQEAFIKGFELCQEKVARKFSELDLSFLGEESEDEAGPSPATTAIAAPLPGTSSSPTPAPECPAEALPLPLGIPLKSTIQRLKKEVLHLTKKSKKMEGELRRLREGHSEATAEATHFRNLHVKGIMEYSRRKADFAKELAECKKSASDRIWAQAVKISALKVELSAAMGKIGQLGGSSSRLLARADGDQQWSKKVSDLPRQLQDVEVSHDVHRASWRRQVEEYKGRLRAATDEVARLQRQLANRAQLTSARDSDELQSLRGTVEGISVALGEKTAELQQLKIQLAYEQRAVADTEAESEVLRKRRREAEAESQRLRRALQDALQRRGS